MNWEVVAEHVVPNNKRDPAIDGLKPEVKEEIKSDSDGLTAAMLFLKMMFGNDWHSKTVRLNEAIERHNESGEGSCVKEFSDAGFLRGCRLFIGVACYASKGKELWKDLDDDDWLTLEPSANFGYYMKKHCF